MKKTAAVHRVLYSQTGATYHDVFDVLRSMLTESIAEAVVLIGDHGKDGSIAGRLDSRSPLVFDTVRQIVERWPQPPDPIQGRSIADLLKTEHVGVQRKPSNAALLRALFRRVAVAGAQGRGSPLVGPSPIPLTTPIPTFDRRSVVLTALGVPNLLHGTEIAYRKRTACDQVHVYLDVSGSINGELKSALYGTVLGSRQFVHPSVHLFSTKVADVTVAQLRNGECRSTGGTDIACVAGHMHLNRVRRAVILTDGWVGRPQGGDRDTLSRAVLGVALTPGSSSRADLQEVANHWTELN